MLSMHESHILCYEHGRLVLLQWGSRHLRSVLVSTNKDMNPFAVMPHRNNVVCVGRRLAAMRCRFARFVAPQRQPGVLLSSRSHAIY